MDINRDSSAIVSNADSLQLGVNVNLIDIPDTVLNHNQRVTRIAMTNLNARHLRLAMLIVSSVHQYLIHYLVQRRHVRHLVLNYGSLVREAE